jgi:hypothetical protein
MERAFDKQGSVHSAAERAPAAPFQFSLAQILLITSEMSVCLATTRIPGVWILTPIMLVVLCLLLHLSRGRIALGVYSGALYGGLALLLTSAARLFSPDETWLGWALFIVPGCALYGGALHAVVSRQILFGLPIVILALMTLPVVVLCWALMLF